MATAAIKLRPIEVSPTTIQYVVKVKSAKKRPAYKKVFYPNGDAKRTLSAPWLKWTDPTMPPYPYGREAHFEEANFGLYGGKKIQSGNKISDGRNKGRTMRKWYPNVRVEQHKSEALGIELSLPVVARVSRTIKKSGGLDQYLLGEKPARLKELGLLGWKLRWLVAKSQVTQARWAEQRAQLGLENKDVTRETFAEAWRDPEVRKRLIEKMSVGWEQIKEKDNKFQKHVQHVMGGTPKISNHRLSMFDPAHIHHIQNLALPEEDGFEELPSTLREPTIPKQNRKQPRAVASDSTAARLQSILESAPKEVVDESIREAQAATASEVDVIDENKSVDEAAGESKPDKPVGI